jgi:hypothetical protein
VCRPRCELGFRAGGKQLSVGRLCGICLERTVLSMQERLLVLGVGLAVQKPYAVAQLAAAGNTSHDVLQGASSEAVQRLGCVLCAERTIMYGPLCYGCRD